MNDSQLIYPSIGIARHRMLVDGDGVTTLIASYGCPLRCRYCLNAHCFRENTKIKNYTVEELIETLAVDDLYFQATGGGVTFGGGEPLLQYRFLHAFALRRPKEWRLGLETSLNVPTEYLKTVMDDFDFFLVDIKDMNPDIYMRYTGKGNEQVLENLLILKEHGLQERVCVRVPHIPGFQQEGDVQRSKEKLIDLGFSNLDEFTYRVSKPIHNPPRSQ